MHSAEGLHVLGHGTHRLVARYLVVAKDVAMTLVGIGVAVVPSLDRLLGLAVVIVPAHVPVAAASWRCVDLDRSHVGFANVSLASFLSRQPFALPSGSEFVALLFKYLAAR